MGYGSITKEVGVEIGEVVLSAEGTLNWDETGADITDVTLRMDDTGERVSAEFLATLTARDWDHIYEAIASY